MGLLGAKRVRFTTADPTWTAAVTEPIVASSAEMADAAELAGPRAYGVRFATPSEPGAALTIWAWPTPGGPGTPPDIIVIAYRVHYQAGNWQAALYHCDVACGEWYDRLDIAELDCIKNIIQVMYSGPASALIPDSLTDWDGRRF